MYITPTTTSDNYIMNNDPLNTTAAAAGDDLADYDLISEACLSETSHTSTETQDVGTHQSRATCTDSLLKESKSMGTQDHLPVAEEVGPVKRQDAAVGGGSLEETTQTEWTRDTYTQVPTLVHRDMATQQEELPRKERRLTISWASQTEIPPVPPAGMDVKDLAQMVTHLAQSMHTSRLLKDATTETKDLKDAPSPADPPTDTTTHRPQSNHRVNWGSAVTVNLLHNPTQKTHPPPAVLLKLHLTPNHIETYAAARTSTIWQMKKYVAFRLATLSTVTSHPGPTYPTNQTHVQVQNTGGQPQAGKVVLKTEIDTVLEDTKCVEEYFPGVLRDGISVFVTVTRWSPRCASILHQERP